MKIRFRFLLVTLVLLVLFTDKAFFEYYTLDENDPVLVQFDYALLGLSLGLTAWSYKWLEPLMKRWLLVVVAAIGALLLESYGGWNSWLVYPHVFRKLTVLLLVFAVYGTHRRLGLPPLPLLAGIVLLVLLGNLAFYHPEALSEGAFLNMERGFAVGSAHLFLPLLLLFLNWYLARGSMVSLGCFFVCLALIIFLQHRTVWISTVVALLLNTLLLRRTAGIRLVSHRLAILVLIPMIGGLVGGAALVLDNPAVVNHFIENLDDIRHAEKQGTGNWRLLQTESYVPLVLERPVLGWRLEGFELPMQFYDPASDMPMWRDGTGHHFHSFYLDRLFYFGLPGLLLVVLVPILLGWRRLRNPVPFQPESAALLAYAASLLVFGISYDWSTYHYALLGLALAAQPVLRPATAAPVSHPEPVPAPDHALLPA